MDDDNQQIIIAQQMQVVVGVLLLNEEGGFDEALSQDIFLGKRRPQGHLLAQMMTAQAGVINFAGFRGLRVQRIAVHEGRRRQGIGGLLIGRAKQLVGEIRLDYLGSSFALDHTMAPFWKKTGFQLVHIAAGKGKSTGRQTIAMLHSQQPDVLKLMASMQQKKSTSTASSGY